MSETQLRTQPREVTSGMRNYFAAYFWPGSLLIIVTKFIWKQPLHAQHGQATSLFSFYYYLLIYEYPHLAESKSENTLGGLRNLSEL